MFKIQKFDLLISIYIFCIAVSELMGGKTFSILNTNSIKLNASVAIFVIPLIFTINDIIAEVFGAERARSIVRSSFVVIFLIFLFSLLAIALPPSSRFLINEKAYDTIFGASARISAASLTAFLISDLLDILIFARMRKKFGAGKLWLRNNVSNFVSQFIDTTLFMFLAFYAFGRPLSDNISFLFSLILPYWLLKCFMSIIETPLAYLGVKWLRSENKNK